MMNRMLRALGGAVAVASLLLAAPTAMAAKVTGAGASFPAPIYAKWASAFSKATGDKVNYQSIGSGGGIKQIIAGTVDFGASDAPLKPEELEKAGLMQFPTVIGGVVPVVNVPGVGPGQMRLSGEVLADIYLRKIRKWSDPAIVALNPGLNLPDRAIAVIRRADGSGTTFLFTHYLSAVSAEWAKKIGVGKAVQWPTGLGGKGNEGVSAFLQRVPASIGYVEYAYAKQNKQAYVMMKNAAGHFVSPGVDSFKAAAEGTDGSAAAFSRVLTNQKHADAWPISGATFILMHKVQKKPAQAAKVLEFFDWCYQNGGDLALQLDYVPLPDSLTALIRDAWGNIAGADGQPVRKAN